jgi:hypothetical protein
MPVNMADFLAKQLRLFGFALKDALPIGHYKTDAQVEPWSSRFGQQDPLLIIIPDMDIACSYIEENPDRQYLVIADASGRNVNKTASMRRLCQIQVPSIIVAAERIADELGILGDANFAVWAWTNEDLSDLLWPSQQGDPSGRPWADYERRLTSCSTYSVSVKTISSQLANEAFSAVSDLSMQKRIRGDDQLVELDDLVTSSFRLVTLLLRLSIPINEQSLSMQGAEEALERINGIIRTSLYLSDEEKAAGNLAREALTNFFVGLQKHNPKAELLRQLVAEHPNTTIICPDARLRPDLELEYSDLGVRVLGTHSDDNGDMPSAVIPGWFRRNRMSMLLEPPIAETLYLVLYGIEHKWYDQFVLSRRKASETRLASSGRARLFPGIEGWEKHGKEIREPIKQYNQSELDDLESIHSQVQVAYRQHVYKTSRSDGSEEEIPAYLVIFEGSSYGFLTESYKANVVTHLIDAVIEQEDERADIRQSSVEDLRPGDVLLFHKGSDKDVIRIAADAILPSGVRTTSSLWRRSLLKYVSDGAMTTEEVWRRLKSAGCQLTQNTIGLWLEDEDMIAPKHERDIRIIVEVTSDKAFIDGIDDVLRAISEVRGAHLRASHQLAKQVMANAVNILKIESEPSQLVEIGPNVFVTRIVEIDDQTSLVRSSLTNRLLEAEQWH